MFGVDAALRDVVVDAIRAVHVAAVRRDREQAELFVRIEIKAHLDQIFGGHTADLAIGFGDQGAVIVDTASANSHFARLDHALVCAQLAFYCAIFKLSVIRSFHDSTSSNFHTSFTTIGSVS